MLYEGGLRVPMIIAWKDHIPTGKTSERVTGFEDWMPTLLELAGASPATATDGISFAPTLLSRPQEDRPFLYREFAGYSGQQSVRAGDWVAVRRNLAKAKTIKTELYNLRLDPSQSQDVAAQNPDMVKQLEAIMRQQHTRSAEFPIPVLDQQK